MSRKINFESNNKAERMRRVGYEQAEPKAVCFPGHTVDQKAANARLEAFLRYAPSGERDVSKQLDAMEQARGTWLREVLDSCEE